MPEPTGTLPAPTLLVVDDDPGDLSLLASLFRGRYHVKVAKGGERGLSLAAADPSPDLILLDILMPDPGGFEVLRRLKGDPSTRGIPVIFLTALADARSEQEGLELGAVDYLTKPIDEDLLRAKIHTFLV